ncbi:hypothetical protein [Actinoplanes sp. NPDC051411]|uniref:hypothetical protein n=1 Tax=Actinoplanes sp. NPDC051411 TaxID=3155522 RepID=UPI003416EA83
MWILLLMFALTCVVGAALIRPRPAPGRHADDWSDVIELPPVPKSLEGALVARLDDGVITRSQYLRAMEQLAARDDERHPLSVPPEAG